MDISSVKQNIRFVYQGLTFVAIVWLILHLLDQQIREFLIAYVVPFQLNSESVHWTIYFAIIVLILGVSRRIIITGYYNREYNHWIFKLNFTFFIGYVYYRFYEVYWTFLPTSWPTIKYIDLLLIPPVAYFLGLCGRTKNGEASLGWIRSKFKALTEKKKDKEKEKVSPENTKFFIEDEIANSDDFGRSTLAKNLAPKLLDQCFKSAFCVGVLGEWGSGKSSFLKFLKCELNKADRSDLEIIDYQPWLNHQDESLIADYFQILKERLGKYDLSLDLKLESYENALNGFDGPILAFLNSVKGTNDSAEKAYRNLENAIKRINKKVVVVIDDLDRLDQRELMQILRLVRNTADFPNFVYILALDRNYVINQISLTNQQESLKYLDKFFQFEINLPSLSSESLFSYFTRVINESTYIPDKYVENINLKQSLEGFFQGAVDSPRDVKRLINAIHFELVDDRFELDFPELVLVQILRIKFFPIYEVLALKRETYFTNVEGYLSINLIKIEADFKNEFKTLPEKNREQLTSILLHLFSRDSTSDPTRGARNPELFDIYFNYRTLSGELPAKTYQNFIDNPHELTSDIEHFINANEIILIDQIMKEPFQNLRELVKVQDALLAIVHFKSNSENFENFEYVSSKTFKTLIKASSINVDLLDGYVIKLKKYIGSNREWPVLHDTFKVSLLNLIISTKDINNELQRRLINDVYVEILLAIKEVESYKAELFRIFLDTVRFDRSRYISDVINFLRLHKKVLQYTLEQILRKNGENYRYYDMNQGLLKEFFGKKPEILLKESFPENEVVDEFILVKRIIDILLKNQILYSFNHLHIGDTRAYPEQRVIIFEFADNFRLRLLEEAICTSGFSNEGFGKIQGNYFVLEFNDHIETRLSSMISKYWSLIINQYADNIKEKSPSTNKIELAPKTISGVEVNEFGKSLIAATGLKDNNHYSFLKVIYYSPNFKPSELS
ncbi:MAG: P-loop NTPase fold protein [Cyclobacteriaceae bacterium]